MDAAWLDLLNSDCNDHLGRRGREDRLEDPKWLRQFLARWDSSPDDRSRFGDREALRDLRELIRRVVERVMVGKDVTHKQWASLNGVLASASVVRRVMKVETGYEIHLIPVTAGLKEVLAEIVASFAEVFTHGDPGRIKLCQNPDCRWVIYDKSKNQSRRWCEGSTGCGNLIKVRRHRARKKQAAKH